MSWEGGRKAALFIGPSADIGANAGLSPDRYLPSPGAPMDGRDGAVELP